MLATFTLRPNPDDLYYLNLSQWVAEHGSFPLRDTIFADLTYPMSNWPPVASYDALVGAAAHLLGTQAATIEYVVVTPLATALSVLALWRLLRAWRAPHLALTLSAALVFLLLDGTSSYATPGNLFLTRLWQGKIILLCLLVPLLLVYALRYVERPSRSTGAWLLLGGIASVALSTTAIFLTPLIALAGAAPLLPRSTVARRGRFRADGRLPARRRGGDQGPGRALGRRLRRPPSVPLRPRVVRAPDLPDRSDGRDRGRLACSPVAC